MSKLAGEDAKLSRTGRSSHLVNQSHVGLLAYAEGWLD